MTPEPHGNFWTGVARVGWVTIFLFLGVVPLALLLTFTKYQLIAGSVGVAIVLIALACGAEYGPRHPDGGRIHNRRR